MIKKLKTEIQKVIIGQEDLVDHLLIGLIAGGHILVEIGSVVSEEKIFF
jgi:MoxR-like ATPase